MPAKQLVVVGHGLCSGLVISGEQEGDHVLGLGETGDLPASMCTIVDAAAIHGDRFISSLLGVEGGLVAQPFPFVGGFVVHQHSSLIGSGRHWSRLFLLGRDVVGGREGIDLLHVEL